MTVGISNSIQLGGTASKPFSGVNFTNILEAAFLYKSVCTYFLYLLTVWLRNLLALLNLNIRDISTLGWG